MQNGTVDRKADNSKIEDARILAQKVVTWIDSEEGQKAIQEALDEAREAAIQSDEQQTPSAETLDKTFTL